MNSPIASQAERWLAQRSTRARSLWAKSGTSEAHLSLVQHLIDTACVAEWLWTNWVSDSLAATLSRLWNLEPSAVKRLYCFLAGTHDVGKASVTFALMREDLDHLVAPIRSAGLSLTWPMGEGPGRKFPHGLASALILRDWLEDRKVRKSVSVRVAAVADAHHGFPTSIELSRAFRGHLEDYDSAWLAVHREILDSMAELTDVDAVLEQVNNAEEPPYGDAVQLMTGLVIMADWMASNELAFPYDEVMAHPERLNRGMEYIDVPAPWRPREVADDARAHYQEIFQWPDDYQPRPAQVAAVEAARRLDGPGLIVIEAPTGEGKTEAGLAAAHVIGHRSGAQGVFLGAPTMATANGLFERTVNWARRSSHSGEVMSMYLAHSKNRLSKDFSALRTPHSQVGYRDIGGDHASDNRDSGAVVAAQWLSGRKTGVLSDFVVGTVDQLLMLALQSRHSMLRHVGLAGKVIIIDEVHAYDAYMSQYLYRALQWLARYGASVILMSATLPPAQRRKLLHAYAVELSETAEEAVSDAAAETTGYPIITSVDRRGVRAITCPQRPTDLDATVELIDDSLELLRRRVTELLSEGGIGLIICNTIARAQNTYSALTAEFGEDVELHHAGFVAAQRTLKEDVLRDQLGPLARRGVGRPLRKIVVATQVAEQSLDIDADVLITDIAPIDLVIQRAGRVHRHQRPATDRPNALRKPAILIRGIERREPTPTFDAGTLAVYGEKLLLATLANLPSRFRRPDDIEDLVRRVYADDPGIPFGWHERWEAAVAEDTKQRDSAERRSASFMFPAPSRAERIEALFERMHSNNNDLPGAGEDQQGLAQVRDSDPAIEVIAVENTEYGYAPVGSPDMEVLAGMEPDWKQSWALAAHTLRLPSRMIRADKDFEDVLTYLERNTPGEWSKNPLLRGQVALNFDRTGSAVVGRFRLNYTQELGLCVSDGRRKENGAKE
ncbi:CRISPR-associated helicase/endonuclease Cas3 [Corynebacterium uterequi]|uniref:CRISPR-associated helicase Cas3/CRISPR-associated endonuclease Cas3-HD n=1 Tax=Corynebacterium uterequi TaxID=1072256 RepID=A0A0G3HEK8_9CORY|nr:CRISPR-associated helicase/endonuclease Cas3 [Corynebacterium uterequi]AKK11724.1 CRISPR-associated helicase Cas3/CRISPR-associated endonuclease Cas3-HD [Corynebacterium uterequi]